MHISQNCFFFNKLFPYEHVMLIKRALYTVNKVIYVTVYVEIASQGRKHPVNYLAYECCIM